MTRLSVFLLVLFAGCVTPCDELCDLKYQLRENCPRLEDDVPDCWETDLNYCEEMISQYATLVAFAPEYWACEDK